ncbi:MAG: delta(1)-pyrroline-2-carboxylate reductase family protein [Chloroflexota bacterium]
MTKENTQVLLPYRKLAKALAAIMRDKASGAAYAPARLVVPLAEGGVLLVMPAADKEIAITKLVTVHTGNSRPGIALPTVQAEVLVMDARTGKRLAILDGEVVTGRRTSALSLLAAQTLASACTGPLLVVGAGTQARYHIEAFIEGLGVRQVFIYSRTMDKAEKLAAYASSYAGGVEAHAISDMREVLSDVTLIVTATTGTTPVIPDEGEGVRADAFIAAVGAFTPTMAELPPALVNRSHVYVDTLDGAQAGAGDLIQAHVDWRDVVELGDALDVARPAGKPKIFKSVGHALWDLAAARLAFAKDLP